MHYELNNKTPKLVRRPYSYLPWNDAIPLES